MNATFDIRRAQGQPALKELPSRLSSSAAATPSIVYSAAWSVASLPAPQPSATRY